VGSNEACGRECAGYVTEEQYRVRYRDTVEDVAAYLKGAPLRMLNPKARERAYGANRL